MRPRRVLATTTTPDGERLELAVEGGHHVLRLGGVPLMTSATHGSEEAMATVAAERWRASPPGAGGARAGGDRARGHVARGELTRGEGARTAGARERREPASGAASRGRPAGARVLVGGLGMGYSLRAALDAFGPAAQVTVAELLPAIVALHREGDAPLAPLAGRPLEDARVTLHVGDVREPLDAGLDAPWDAVLLDVDNGPDAFTVRGNHALYGERGVRRIVRGLAPGGVVVVWSAYPSPAFLARLRAAGLDAGALPVRARGGTAKGARHVLFVGRRPSGVRPTAARG